MRARVVLLLISLALVLGLSAAPVAAAALTVNSLADGAPADDGSCTLREAIIAANTDTASGALVGECAAGSGADVISFSVAGTITLGSALPALASPFNELSIVGAGAVTVNGGGAFQVFHNTGVASLSGLTITNGSTGGSGGGIANNGILTITNSTISGNSAGGFGGGISSSGIVTITNSTISGNSSGTSGGGFANITGIADITNSTISGNSADNIGGGIHTQSASIVDVTNSTISGNSADNGGGIAHTNAILTVTNATISGNTGGGIDNSATATVTNSLVAGNPPVEITNSGGTLNLTNNVVATSSTGILAAAGLADNGGPTQTVALAMVAGNPAVDAGNATTCAATPVSALDQRGMPRPAACDIGAYEVQPPTVAAHADVSAAATSAAGAAVTFTPPPGTDEQGGVAAVACVPASGSTFPIGSTTVTCTATDAVGHTGTGTFQVIVGAFAAPSLPDAAMADPMPASPWATLGFAALLLGSLAAVAAVNFRGVVRRRR